MRTLRPSTVLTFVCGLLLLGGTGGCSSSSGPVIGSDIERRVYLVQGENVTKPPQIIGGYAKVKQVQSYPEAAARDNAYGVIWLQCTVTAGGVATRVQLAKGGHPALETEALNVLQKLEFRPAQHNGAPVQSKIQIPVIFQGPYARPKKEG